MLYVNVHDVIEAIVDELEPSQRDQYREEVSPFVDSIQAFFMGTNVENERTDLTLIVTFE